LGHLICGLWCVTFGKPRLELGVLGYASHAAQAVIVNAGVDLRVAFNGG